MFDQYDTPDIGRENYEACREEERETERDRYTVAEAKELQTEWDADQLAVEEAKAEAVDAKNRDYANDMRV